MPDLAQTLQADPEELMILALRQSNSAEVVDQIRAALIGAGSLGRVTPEEVALLQEVRAEARRRGVSMALMQAHVRTHLAASPMPTRDD